MFMYQKFAKILLLCFVLIHAFVAVAQQSAHRVIEVTDAETGTPVADAVLFDGKTYHSANQLGIIQLPHNVLSVSEVKVTAMGYRRATLKSSEIISHQPYRLALHPQVNMLKEAVVTGQKVMHSQNVVAREVSSADLQKHLGSTLAASLEQVKGISMVQTGVTIAKPVLHGMYGNRLLIVNNGVRQQGQQWGADHAPELDANAAGKIRVIKGAEAIRYGTEALGGVIEMDSRELPYTRKQLRGNIASLYGSNGRRIALTGYADGGGLSLGEGVAAWRVQGTYINGGDRSTANYLLNNTGMREANASLALGWKKGKDYGIDLSYSIFSTRIGVLYWAQMGDTELLSERIAIGLKPEAIQPFSRKVDYPNQKVQHHTARIKGYYGLPNGSKLSLQYAFQSDVRDEFHQRRNNNSHIPSLSLRLSSSQVDAAWQHFYNERWKTEVGTFVGFVNNRNVRGTGVVPIIPNYTQFNGGAFALQKYTGDHWGVEAGIRADHQRLSADGYNAEQIRYGGKRNYTNLTYTVGAHYHLSDRWDVLTNIGLAWRAPHVHELYSRGLEHASGLYSVGDSTLLAEQSTKWVVSANYHSDKFTFTADAYLQWIKNYIYDEPTGETTTLISGKYPVFAYRRADAVFRGIDAEIKWQVHPKLTYELGGSAIWANEQHTGNYLPYIPSARLTQSIGYQLGDVGHLHGVYAKLMHKFVDKQRRFNPDSDLIPYSPPAYHLLGAELGATWLLPNGRKINFLLSADNLLNKEYREYTNRFRYYAHDLGRDVRLMVSWSF